MFDKFEAALAQAMLSLPATKGFEMGEGFAGCTGMLGSEHNDKFGPGVNNGGRVSEPGKYASRIAPVTNHAGGTLGGITSGASVVFKVAFKAVSSIGQRQEGTVDYAGNPTIVEVKGRHDPCVLPRCPPIVEAMASLVTADMLLRQGARSAWEKDISGFTEEELES